jgi:pseudaminic acid synthase
MIVKINKNIAFDYKKPPLIIAEISSNHQGSKKKFLELINQAYNNGADLVKIQTYEPEDITFNNKDKFYVKEGLWKGENLWELYKKAHTPFSWHHDAFKIAKKRGKILFSTPFSLRALNFLKKFNPPLYKISSFEITDINLIYEIAKIKKPIILSTGASNLKEIENAVKVIRKVHNKIILLHCVSNYPTPVEGANIQRVEFLKKKFKKCLIGLSDHSQNISSSLCATTIGVVAIEKHVKLNEFSKSEDSDFSISIKNLKMLKKISNEVYLSKGSASYSKEVNPMELKTRIYRRSIYASKLIKKGELFSKKNIKTLRPLIGLPANLYNNILGKKCNTNIEKDCPIKKINIKKNFK